MVLFWGLSHFGSSLKCFWRLSDLDVLMSATTAERRWDSRFGQNAPWAQTVTQPIESLKNHRNYLLSHRHTHKDVAFFSDFCCPQLKNKHSQHLLGNRGRTCSRAAMESHEISAGWIYMEKETSTLKQLMSLAKWKRSALNDEERKGHY